MAKKKSNAGNAYILSQLNSYKGFSMPKVNVKAKPKADASKKKVEPKKKVENKKSGPSLYDTKVKDQYGKPVVNKPSDSKKKPYGMASKNSDEKKVVKKVETKKVVTKKPEVKKVAPVNKDLLNKMTRTGQAFYLDTKTGKLEKNPDWNTEVGVKKLIKKTEDFKKGQSKKVKSKIESLKRPEIRKKVTIPEVVVTPPKKSEPTVSQLWQQKTGTSWSEAKKQGLTDGSASANNALMKKLKSGTVNKESIKAPKPGTAASMDVFKKEMEKNVQSELSGETTYEPPVPAMRRGGSIKKMRKGGITKRRK